MPNVDEKYISKCFKLAERGSGFVSPNPLVGAVLVKNGKVIGEGWHKKLGEAHAEVNAINSAKENAAGSTLFCNLEPCCHTNKKTPPCVPLIIKSKINKVVISNIDPNPDVNGNGIRQLKEAGVEVITGVFEEEGNELNKFYFKFVKEKLPYITLKIAQSVDGKISLSQKEQTWLTGKDSVKFVHKLRSEYDAILIGAGTIKTDNPLLNVREVKGRDPVRIIIDGNLNIPLKSKVIKSQDPQKTIILTSNSASKKKVRQLSSKGIQIFRFDTNKKNYISLKSILNFLTDHRFTSVFVEGGSKIFTQFFNEDIFDEIIVLQANKVLGSGINAFNTDKMKKIKLLSVEKMGDDIKLIYRKNLGD